jgi:hypothetical protein
MSKQLNTHNYDRKLKNIYKPLKNDDELHLIQPISFENTIKEIVSKIPLNRHLCKTTIRNIIKSLYLMKFDNNNNYDNENDIHVEDILPRVWRFVQNYDDSTLDTFWEQMSEISKNGPCAQGRTTRLFQFYFIHMDSKDYIYKKYLMVK